MDLFRWDESYSVGVAEFDADHRRLLQMANAVVEQVVRKGGDTVSDVLDQLALYAEQHFQREENLMQRSAYTGLEEHRQEHRRLLMEVRLLKSRFIADDMDPAEVAKLMVDWVVIHIQRMDQAYGAHLNAHGFR